MFGNNPIRKQDLSSPSQLWVQEVFPTIQGEGPFAGEGAIFVRLGGCNLKCYWCDTDFESSTWHPHIDELMGAIFRAGEQVPKNDLVVLTGGEPMRQNILPFIQELLKHKYRVQIETNGTLWIPGLDELQFEFLTDQISIICSPKSGRLNEKIEQYAIAYKYIVSAKDYDPADGLPVMSTQVRDKTARIARPPEDWPGEVFVQPLDEQNEFRNRMNEEHAVTCVKKFGYRLSYQLHKHLGLP